MDFVCVVLVFMGCILGRYNMHMAFSCGHSLIPFAWHGFFCWFLGGIYFGSLLIVDGLLFSYLLCQIQVYLGRSQYMYFCLIYSVEQRSSCII